MSSKLEKLANSKFMESLRQFSIKLSTNPTFDTISTGMAGTMGLIMLTAIIQVIVAIVSIVFKIEPTSFIYETLYMPYRLIMGLFGIFMAFNLAYNYSKKLKVGYPVQNGFIALISFILISSPVQKVTVAGKSFNAINIDTLGATGLFVAIVVGLLSVRITKFAIDKKLIIKMPDVVPEGVISGFNAIIPAALNIIIWYGISVVLSVISDGQLNLSFLIIYLLSIPIRYLVSPLGMVVIILLGQVFWFFGIHGTGVIFSVIMVPYIAAHTLNAELAASGMPLVFSAIFLYGANGLIGGTGNTLSLVLMGLKSKSKQIKAISEASLIPSLFNINEPVIFGFPLMYNPIMLIPFLLSPMVVMVFLGLGYYYNLMTYPSILILSAMPIGVSNYMSSLDIRNAIFPFLMIPVTYVIYYPFFKIYEKELVQKEKIEEEKNS